MKTELTLICFILFQSFSFAQNFDLITDVKMQVLAIDKNLNQLTKSVEHDDSISTRYSYKNDQEIELITVSLSDLATNSYKDVKWYFSEGNLIYTEQIWTDISSGEITYYNKFYTQERKLIAWENNDGLYIDEFTEEFHQVEKELIAYTDSLLKR